MRKKILPVSNGELKEQPLICFVLVRRAIIDENKTPSPHYSSITHDFRVLTEADIKCLEEVVLAWIDRVAAGRPYIL